MAFKWPGPLHKSLNYRTWQQVCLISHASLVHPKHIRKLPPHHFPYLIVMLFLGETFRGKRNPQCLSLTPHHPSRLVFIMQGGRWHPLGNPSPLQPSLHGLLLLIRTEVLWFLSPLMIENFLHKTIDYRGISSSSDCTRGEFDFINPFYNRGV